MPTITLQAREEDGAGTRGVRQGFVCDGYGDDDVRVTSLADVPPRLRIDIHEFTSQKFSHPSYGHSPSHAGSAYSTLRWMSLRGCCPLGGCLQVVARFIRCLTRPVLCQVGQCGNQVGQMLFERLVAQSATAADRAADTELFRWGPDGRRRARCLLVDTEPKVVGAVLASDREGLFSRQQCYMGQVGREVD